MSAIKRIHRDLIEWREAERNFGTIFADPIEDDMFIWHFNLVVESDANPISIHGQIKFPSDYPFSPPAVSFFGCVPHHQVSRGRGKMARLCLDMLQGNNQGYYSGWSSAYSVVSVLAQIETLVDDFSDQPSLQEWQQFTCSRCSHDGSRPDDFHPRVRMRIAFSRSPASSKSESSADWSLLNRDVEGVIFSFLSQNDYRVLVHVDTRIKHILCSYRWYHWKTIECYHSHENFGGFMSSIKNGDREEADLALKLFGIGFSVDYFKNGGRGRTELVLKDVYVMPDILCYGAFKEGVTFSMWRDMRFTSFLPLYLNNMHGSHAMTLAEEVIREQYQVPLTKALEPTMVLKFLTKLMNTTVVSLMREVEDSQRGDGDGVELFTSIKALQSYMYFYHLLLGFCRKYPRITSHARKKVFDFVAKSNCRNKKNYPDLGEFLVYLSIVPDMEWSKFGPIFTEECFVRDAKWILQKHPELIVTDGPSDVSCIRLRRTWETSKVGKRLMMFQYYFLHNVCGVGTLRSSEDGSVALNLSAQLERYNRTLGQVDESVAIGLQRRCRVVFQVDDWMQYFSMVNLPCPSAMALTHLLRVSMLESDRKGYQRFVELRELKEDDLIHKNSDLCLCSGMVRSLGERQDGNMDGSNGFSMDMPVTTRRYLDVAFSVDCTGSMSSYLQSVKEHIEAIAMQLTWEVANLDVRFAIVGYRDHGSEAGNWHPSVTKWYGFTPVDTFRRNLSQIHVGGGGGVEAVADAWHQVLGLNWRRASVKAVIHIADIGGHGLTSEHDVCPDGFDPIALVREMLVSDITLYNVGCRMRGLIHEQFYKATAFMTGGLYLTLDNALKLPEVIVESTREGMSLTAVVPQVYGLVKELKKEQPHATKDQLAYLVWKELVARRVTTRKVKCVVIDTKMSPQVYAASGSRDLAQCREILNDYRYGHLANRMMAPRPKMMEGGRTQSDDRLITLEQTLRCVTRAEHMGDRMEWATKGCVYQMAKYNSQAARARYGEHGMEYSGKLIRIKNGNFHASDTVEYHDYKTKKWYEASVVNVNESKYSVTVVIRGLRNARRQVPLTSRLLREVKKTKKNTVNSRSRRPVAPTRQRPSRNGKQRQEPRRRQERGKIQAKKNVVVGRRPTVTAVRVQLQPEGKTTMKSKFASMTRGRRVSKEVNELKKEERNCQQMTVAVAMGRNPSPSPSPVPPLNSPPRSFPVPVPVPIPVSVSVPMSVRSFSMTEADMSERSALCVVLPQYLWQDIATIRREHDKSFQHWRIPVIKLVCPFVDRTLFEEHADNLGRRLCASDLTPFKVKLTGFGAVNSTPRGGQKMVEVFLKTEIVCGNDRSWHVLMGVLSEIYPNRVHFDGDHELNSCFKARIVVGQLAKKNAQRVVRGWKGRFGKKEMTFRVRKVCLLSRCGFNAPFAVENDVMFE